MFGLSNGFIDRLMAWNAASPLSRFDPDKVRQDCDGWFIKWDEYGQYSDYGWQIDHAWPTALGGADTYANKRARHWRGNSRAGGILGGIISK
jgi:hypothetical protein